MSLTAWANAAEIRVAYDPKTDAAIQAWLDRNVPALLDIYKDFHAHPELSLNESRTAARVASALNDAGLSVTPNVGGHGVVAVLHNGAGPTLLIRGDMDALPITEQTQLPYASTVTASTPSGESVGVMHACGHDVHSTMLIATAQFLAENKNLWNGTLVALAQPAEEIGRGARSMIDDGLFTRFPKPDFCISLHVAHSLPAGHIGYTAGWAFANVDSVDIVLHGHGGHGSRPHETVDPIVASAHLITALQTIVSRRVDPTTPAVITVGSIHAGSKHNIIPDSVKMQLTVRSYADDVRALLLDSIRQIAADTAKAFNCPKAPDVTLLDEFTPASYNDPDLTAAAADLFRSVFGQESVTELSPEMGGEDFGLYARNLKVPGLQYRVGATDPVLLDASRQPGGPSVPSVHSAMFAPVPEPTLRASVRSLANLAAALMPPD